MKNVFLGALLFTSALVLPLSTTAGVDVGINISLPPPIVFATPPVAVVIPETYVYVVPDLDVDVEIFFYNGWWWRPWEGRWYRSRHYNSGWSYYQRVPSFYTEIPSSWRNDYRDRQWAGHPWNYQRIPHQQLQRNWSNWKKSNHWEKQQTWGVQGLKPRTRPQPPAQTVQPKSQVIQPVKTEAKPQQSRPHPQEVRPRHSQPEPQAGKSPLQGESKPQQSRPHPQEVQPRHTPPQHPEMPQQFKPHQGQPERGHEEKQDRK